MFKAPKWVDRSLSFFVFGVMACIWLALILLAITDWPLFLKIIKSLEGTSQFIILFLLIGGPFWLIKKLKKRSISARDTITNAEVVYLRAFSDDANAVYEFAQAATFSTERSLEQLLVEELKSIGTVVTIGRPDEMLMRDGAARLYVGLGQDWQTCVERLLVHARAIVLVAGSTPGLLWEKKHVRRNVRPEQLLVVLPPSSKKKRRKIIQNLERAFEVSFPALEDRSRLPGFLSFDADWHVAPLEHVYSSEWKPVSIFGWVSPGANRYVEFGQTLSPFISRFMKTSLVPDPAAKTSGFVK